MANQWLYFVSLFSFPYHAPNIHYLPPKLLCSSRPLGCWQILLRELCTQSSCEKMILFRQLLTFIYLFSIYKPTEKWKTRFDIILDNYSNNVYQIYRAWARSWRTRNHLRIMFMQWPEISPVPTSDWGNNCNRDLNFLKLHKACQLANLGNYMKNEMARFPVMCMTPLLADKSSISF